MQNAITEDIETWLRYLKSKLDKQFIDFSALYRLITLIIQHPECKDLFVSHLVSLLSTEVETEAITVLHMINTIVINYRLTVRDNSDAVFLGKFFDMGGEVLESHSSGKWRSWNKHLSRTLFEWRLNYKLENRLSPTLASLVSLSEKETSNFKNQHYTLFEEQEKLVAYLRTSNSESISNNYIRVLKHAARNLEPNKEPYRQMLCSYTGHESWHILMALTEKYLENTLSNPNTASLAFRSTSSDKLGMIPHSFVAMHAATFIESSVGACVRAIIGLMKNTSIESVLHSAAYERCVNDLLAFFKYTLENLHRLNPLLAKYICEVCNVICRLKKSFDYWSELNGLLILRLVAPAVSNPMLAGIVDSADMNAVQLLHITAKIIQHAWVGIPIEHGELHELPWLNANIPTWAGQLQQSFTLMYEARKGEPKDLSLPYTLLTDDLTQLHDKMQGLGWSRVNEPLVRKNNHALEEVPEEIQYSELEDEEIVIQQGKTPYFGQLKPKNEVLEDSTPSLGNMPLLPPKEKEQPAFSNLAAKQPLQNAGCQTDPSYNATKMTQTREELSLTKSIQTEPETQKYKIRSRLENSVPVNDQATATEELPKVDTDKIDEINNYWANQFAILKEQNEAYKKQITELKEVVAVTEETPRKELMDSGFTHIKLQDEMKERLNLREDSMLKQCDPIYYLGLQDVKSSRYSTDRHYEAKYDQDFKRRIAEVLLTFKR